MGCGMSSEDNVVKRPNLQCETQSMQGSVVPHKDIKIVLLGAGESGKSTFLKQMKLIHEGGYSHEERKLFKPIIFSNTVQSMRVIIEAMELLAIPYEDKRALSHVQIILAKQEQLDSDNLSPGTGRAISVLWRDAGVRQCFQRSHEYQLNDSAKYYFDSIDRIAAPDYTPNDEDVLRSRLKTTGVTETTFIIGGLIYRMVDIGGQRTERKKWIRCFENVTAVLFLVAISEYDQSLFEDETVNRMQEALALFDSICHSRWFIETPIILLFNKTDIFRDKLLASPMQKYFSDYNGGPDFIASCEFIMNRFVSLNQRSRKQMYTHFTCATNTTEIECLFTAINGLDTFSEATVLG